MYDEQGNSPVPMQAPGGATPPPMQAPGSGEVPAGGGMTMEGFEKYLASLPPEEANKLRDQIMSDPQARQEMAKMQMSQAQELRAGSPQMRNAGGVSMAANPLEFLGAAMQNNNARNKSQEGEQNFYKAMADKAGALRGVGGFLGSRGQGQEGGGRATIPMPQTRFTT